MGRIIIEGNDWRQPSRSDPHVPPTDDLHTKLNPLGFTLSLLGRTHTFPDECRRIWDHITAAKPGDEGRIEELSQQIAGTGGSMGAQNALKIINSENKLLNGHYQHLFCYRDGGTVQGYTYLVVNEDADVGCSVQTSVDPSMRGRKIGTFLLAKAMDGVQGRTQKFYSLPLEAGRRLLEGLGFSPVRFRTIGHPTEEAHVLNMSAMDVACEQMRTGLASGLPGKAALMAPLMRRCLDDWRLGYCAQGATRKDAIKSFAEYAAIYGNDGKALRAKIADDLLYADKASLNKYLFMRDEVFFQEEFDLGKNDETIDQIVARIG
jgi:GNAT superfamily N-acetyltransferase